MEVPQKARSKNYPINPTPEYIVKENKNILYAENLYYDKINNKISPSKEGKPLMDLRDYTVAKSNTEKELNSICDKLSSEILRMKEYLKLNKMKEDFE